MCHCLCNLFFLAASFCLQFFCVQTIIFIWIFQIFNILHPPFKKVIVLKIQDVKFKFTCSAGIGYGVPSLLVTRPGLDQMRYVGGPRGLACMASVTAPSISSCQLQYCSACYADYQGIKMKSPRLFKLKCSHMQ